MDDMNTVQNVQNEELEIDLTEIFYALKDKLFQILATGLLFACIACAVTVLLIKPTYTSKATVLAMSKEETLTTISDLQFGSQLTEDYQALIVSRPVLEMVINNLKLDYTADEMKKMISVSNITDTRLIEIEAVSGDAKLSKDIVNELAVVSSAYIGDKMEVIPPKVIEEGQIPLVKTGPNVKLNTILGLVVGMILAVGIICIRTVVNDTIKNEDDIEKYLGLSTLASVPDRKDFVLNKSVKTKRKKRKSPAKKKMTVGDK